MTREDPMNPEPNSRWKFVSVIAIIVIFGVAFALNFVGWDLKPFGSNFRSQPTAAPTSPPVKK
jgi:hypothetical protein